MSDVDHCQIEGETKDGEVLRLVPECEIRVDPAAAREASEYLFAVIDSAYWDRNPHGVGRYEVAIVAKDHWESFADFPDKTPPVRHLLPQGWAEDTPAIFGSNRSYNSVQEIANEMLAHGFTWDAEFQERMDAKYVSAVEEALVARQQRSHVESVGARRASQSAAGHAR